MSEENSFKKDIENAERLVLIFSWLGTLTASAIIGYSIWGIT